MRSGVNFHAEIAQLFCRAGPQILGKCCEDLWSAFNQNNTRTGWVDVAEITCQGVTRDLRNRSGHFDPGRSAANNDKGHRRSARRRIGEFFGIFECQQNPAPNFHCIFKALQAGGKALPFRMPEIRMARASCKNQIIVGKIEVARMNNSLVHINRLHFGQHHFDVLAFVQNRAHRRGDVSRRERSGRDLIKERLKEVVIGAVEDSELNVLAG